MIFALLLSFALAGEDTKPTSESPKAWQEARELEDSIGTETIEAKKRTVFITPLNLEFKDIEVNGTTNANIAIRNDSPKPVTVTLRLDRAEHFIVAQLPGEVSIQGGDKPGWASFEGQPGNRAYTSTTTFEIGPWGAASREIAFTARRPGDEPTRPGVHYDTLRVTTDTGIEYVYMLTGRIVEPPLPVVGELID